MDLSEARNSMPQKRRGTSLLFNWLATCVGIGSLVVSQCYLRSPNDVGWGILYSLPLNVVVTFFFLVANATANPTIEPMQELTPSRQQASKFAWGAARFVFIFALFLGFAWLSFQIPDAEPRNPSLGPKMDPSSREQWLTLSLLAAPFCAVVAGYWRAVFGKSPAPPAAPPIIEG